MASDLSSTSSPPSTVGSSSPNSSSLELKYIRALFFRQDYRTCLTVGEALLKQLSMLEGDVLEIHRAYINFFLGLAHDDLARQMYDRSKFKRSRFELAERHFEEARQCLNVFQQGEQARKLPETPVTQRRALPREHSSFALFTLPPTPISQAFETAPGLALWQKEHLRAKIGTMNNRIEVQLEFVRQAKAKIDTAEAKRAMARLGTPGSNDVSTPSPFTSGKKLQAAKSFWLFTPEMAQKDDKQKRIEQGRAREWKRPRFQPARYRALAEQALAEL